MPIIDGWHGGDIDVAVVGAGAAGLAAARRIMSLSSLSVIVLEAGARVGGRAFTVVPPDPAVPIDLGCSWLHASTTNAWTAIAPEVGYTVDQRPAPWNFGETRLDLSPADEADFGRAEDDFDGRIAAELAAGHDCAMGELIAPDHRWRPLLEAISTFVSGAELDRVSCRDYDGYRPGDGPDWRVVEGYGSLVARYGATVPTVLDAAVTAIDHGGRNRIGLTTGRGTLDARAVVVTVSTDVLAAGVIRFSPALPDKLDAAARLPLGLADKLYLRMDRPEAIPAETYRLGSPFRARTAAYLVRPHGRPVIEAFWGGPLARDLEAGDEATRKAAMAAFVIEELTGLFGSNVARTFVPIRSSAWGREPFIRGSYAYAVPGAADCRALLAAPVDDRLFFAGEATSPERYTTAHGAYESGVTAADAVVRALGQSRRT